MLTFVIHYGILLLSVRNNYKNGGIKMRNHKKIAYEEIISDRKFKFYKLLCAGIGVLFVVAIVTISILN